MPSFFDLSLDVKLIVLKYLDNRSLAHLSQTCTYFGMLVRKVISFRKAQVTLMDQLIPQLPPVFNYRAGAAVGSNFYMPFIDSSPFCYSYDLQKGAWSKHKLNLIDMDDIQPQITCAAVIGNKIYLICGRLLNSYTLSNGMIEIDITTFNTKMIRDAQGVPPRPRHEHSVDTIHDRYLVVFGGLCYNSVGENDVFVYDTFNNSWFVPPITGHFPHLRFGHASTAVRNNLYIHGGAQLDNDSSYIVYEDLYKLDCDTWTWYKYEHPEIERFLRTQPSTSDQSPQREHLIATNGDDPYDRFQSYMCSYSNKLIIFGGHSIRQDEDDNEILCSYPIDELCVFNTKRNSWALLRAETKDLDSSNMGEVGDEDTITVSDMSVATIPLGSTGIRIFIIAGRKAAEVPKCSQYVKHQCSSSSDGFLVEATLPSITESFFQQSPRFDDDIPEENEDSNGIMMYSDDSDQEHCTEGDEDEHIPVDDNDDQDFTADTREPNSSDKSDRVKELFQTLEPDVEQHDSAVCFKPNKSHTWTSSNGKSKRKKPSISVLHQDGDSIHHKKACSGSSLSSHNSSSGAGKRKSRYQHKIIPCTILLDLME